MKVYAYIRVSTEMQTLANQEHEIKRYCNKFNLVVEEWVSESVSGTIPVEKRMLGKMIDKMDRGDLLIATELSRLGRNMLMIMSILNMCSSKGIAIHTIKDNFDLSDSINSKIIAFAFALAAEIERNLISQRTKEALAVKRLEGKILGRPPGSSKKKVKYCKMRAEIASMLHKGISYTQIARSVGIHRNTLRKYLISDNIFEKNKLFSFHESIIKIETSLKILSLFRA